MWFPTVLSFVAAAIAYVIDPSLANDKLYLVLVMLGVFWALTLANFFGMKWAAAAEQPGRDHRDADPGGGADRDGRLLARRGKAERDPVSRAASSFRT